jgi:hypothetical protein
MEINLYKVRKKFKFSISDAISGPDGVLDFTLMQKWNGYFKAGAKKYIKH